MRVGLIVGPTGVGKTSFALSLAEELGAEIVNADSRQFYRGMNVGTAKPSHADRARVPHHLIDIRPPGEPLDVAAFARLAHDVIAAITARGRPALVVGGSGLYLRVLCGGIFAGPPACEKIRAELNALDAARLYRQLAEVDAASASWIAPNDRRRLVRALEVYRLTGVPLSEHQRRHAFAARSYDTLWIGLEIPRARLYERLNQRFDQMVAAGLADEVRALLAAGVKLDALGTIGYRQIAANLRGELELARAVELAKRDTRRLAKRQLTWFRHERAVVWLDPMRDLSTARELLKSFFANDGPDGKQS
ncbi:MAG: tRNA (adenosine(37)-N6)-dimethylallyltransferase MiaA [Candidatus Binataceae bacterium]